MLAICHAKRRYNHSLDLSPGARHAATLWRMVVRLLFGGYVVAPGADHNFTEAP
jgi:hypothetical protein